MDVSPLRTRMAREPFLSQEGFAAAPKAWLRCGWEVKYVYAFTWLARPINQLPENLVLTESLFPLNESHIAERPSTFSAGFAPGRHACSACACRLSHGALGQAW